MTTAIKGKDWNRELTKLKLRVQARAPFWANFIYMKKGVSYKDSPTSMQEGWKYGATDGEEVFISEDTLAWPDAQQEFVLVHELVHFMFNHPLIHKIAAKQGKFAGLPFVPDIFTYCVETFTNACVLASYDDQKQAAAAKPPAGVFDATVKHTDSLFNLYKRFYQAPPPPPPGGGAGAGPAGMGQDLLDPPGAGDAHPEDLERAEEAMRVRIKQAGEMMKAVGSVPGGFERWLIEQAEPKIDWRQHMVSLFRPWIGHEKLDFTRLNRKRYLRSGGLVIAPTRRGIRMGTVVVIYDTSGSISGKEIVAFTNELAGILEHVNPQLTIVAGIDMVEPKKWAEIQNIDELASVAPVITGGGGTDFRPAFKWVEKQGFEPEALVYLTDLCGPWPKDPPAYPVFWCCTTDIKCSWGETVRLDLSTQP